MSILLPAPINKSIELIGTRFTDPLIDRYEQPHRKYHTLKHISYMLRAIDQMAIIYGLTEDDRALLHYATWLHDAVYEIGSKTNEEDSAAIMWNIDAKISYKTMLDIVPLVLVTKTHKNPRTFLEALIIDADLMGLGAIGTTYAENAYKIQEEYNVDPLLWMTGRIDFLLSMLLRPMIYQTSFGALCEESARANMNTELVWLRSLAKS